MRQATTSKAAAPQIKPADLRKFHKGLMAWYETHGRHDLPWRKTDDPYRIWLSEVMLQQTQVSTVLARFYHPFLEKFPTVKALADAPREKVMKAWEGLGYYTRARNLHEAAKQISNLSPRARPGVHLGTEKQDGPRRKAGVTVKGNIPFPNTVEELLKLPGIGKNTAQAVAAFAYHQPVAILEANVKRVVARIFALETPKDEELWAGAETLLNHNKPFDHNQAMMDLGSLICTPKKPACVACPANVICEGQKAPELYPTKKVKKQVPIREVFIHVREDAGGRLFLEARDAKLLGGLYGFPQSESPSSRRKPGSKDNVNDEANGPRSRVEPGMTELGTVTHVYSHFKLIGTVLHESVREKTNSPDWYTRDEIAGLPLSKLDHKVLSLVENCHSGEKKRAKPGAKKRSR